MDSEFQNILLKRHSHVSVILSEEQHGEEYEENETYLRMTLSITFLYEEIQLHAKY